MTTMQLVIVGLAIVVGILSIHLVRNPPESYRTLYTVIDDPVTDPERTRSWSG